ncbi:MAG: hypothetical protein [Olavius algarvensis Gamma 1 endosymbiont]|nr:MAG: hypothetical protein [Olavius algarvensis Gamma 1 endosymbiont]
MKFINIRELSTGTSLFCFPGREGVCRVALGKAKPLGEASPWERARASRSHRVPTTKRRGFRSSPCLFRSSAPAPSRQDAGAPSVPRPPACRLPNRQDRQFACSVQPKGSPGKWIST